MNPYLVAYLRNLQTNPLRTKAWTSGILSALQESLATYLSGQKPANGGLVDPKVLKMFIYGFCISAPLSHTLTGILQKAFEGKTSATSKILQIIASNLFVSPIQNSVYLATMAFIAGARSMAQIEATVKAGFLPLMRISWVVSPIMIAIAQKFIQPTLWVPFFNLCSFVLGVYFNTQAKLRRAREAKRLADKDNKEKR